MGYSPTLTVFLMVPERGFDSNLNRVHWAWAAFSSPPARPRRLHKSGSVLRLPVMKHAVLITVSDQPGTLFQLTRVLAEHNANISYVDIIRPPTQDVQIYFEFRLEGSAENVLGDLGKISNVR